MHLPPLSCSYRRDARCSRPPTAAGRTQLTGGPSSPFPASSTPGISFPTWLPPSSSSFPPALPMGTSTIRPRHPGLPLLAVKRAVALLTTASAGHTAFTGPSPLLTNVVIVGSILESTGPHITLRPGSNSCCGGAPQDRNPATGSPSDRLLCTGGRTSLSYSFCIGSRHPGSPDHHDTWLPSSCAAILSPAGNIPAACYLTSLKGAQAAFLTCTPGQLPEHELRAEDPTNPGDPSAPLSQTAAKF